MEMTHAKIMSLIDELIDSCVKQNIAGTISIYGGSAMAYHLPTLRTTQAIDSISKPYSASY